jgi:hypothetical protein
MSQEQQWRVLDAEGNECGPYTAEQLQAYAADGTISPTTQVWTEGLETWIPALEIEGLFPVGVRRPQLLTGPAMPAGRPLGSPHPSLPEGASAITVSQPPSGASTLILIAVLILVLGAYFAYKLCAPEAVAAHDSPEAVPESEVVPGKSEPDAIIAPFELTKTNITIISIIVACVGGIWFLLLFLYYNRCPNCKKWNKLRLTGRDGEEEHSFTGSMLRGSAEWTCRNCGHTFWRTYSRRNPHHTDL